MSSWFVKLTIRRMGRQCRSCRQDFECEVEAANEREAVDIAKALSDADQETHQFNVNIVRKLS